MAQNDNCESVTLTGKVAARAAVVVLMLRASVADVFGILANLCAISNGTLHGVAPKASGAMFLGPAGHLQF